MPPLLVTREHADEAVALSRRASAEDAPRAAHEPHPRRAASILAMSIFFIVIIASIARLARRGVGIVHALDQRRGTICQLNPNLSLHQLHTLSCPPPLTIAFQ